MKVLRPGTLARVGDYIREGWDTETRSIQPPYNYGLVIETEARSLGPYTQEQIDESPIRRIRFLTNEGKIIGRYAVHIEVICESR